jgi:hypothetical protein
VSAGGDNHLILAGQLAANWHQGIKQLQPPERRDFWAGRFLRHPIKAEFADD